MNKFKDDFKRSLDSATNDKESRVEKASYDLLNVLDNINQDELSTTQFDTFASIVAQLKKHVKISITATQRRALKSMKESALSKNKIDNEK